MELELIVSEILPLVTGQGARGEWKKQDVVFDIPQQSEFSRKLCVGFWTEKAEEAAALRPGDKVLLSVNIESREYNGRWFTDVRAWRMTRLEGGVSAGQPQAATSGYQQSQPQQSQPQDQATSAAAPAAAEQVDDLPF